MNERQNTKEADAVSLILDEFTNDEKSNAALDAVVKDVNLQHQMRRFLLIGQAIRRELPAQIDDRFSIEVMSGLHALSTDSSDRKRPKSRKGFDWWSLPVLKPLAGLAVAVSVAIVSVTFWQTNLSVTPVSNAEQVATIEQQKIEYLANQGAQGKLATAFSRLDNGMHWKTDDQTMELQQKLNAYLVSHTEYSNSFQGLISQARVAGFDAP